MLENSQIFFILTVRLNQDPIENLFGLIRQRGGVGNRRNPTVKEFNNLLGQIMSIKFLRNSALTNCYEDDDEILIQDLITTNDLPNKESFELTLIEDRDNVDDFIEQPISVTCNQSEDNHELLEHVLSNDNTSRNFDDCAIRYYLGYTIFKCLGRTYCQYCETKWVKKDNDANITITSEYFIFMKNYVSNKNFGSLRAPTELLFDLCKPHIQIFEETFNEHCNAKKLKQLIIDRCIHYSNGNSKYKYWFCSTNPCSEHNYKLLDFLILVLLRKHTKWFYEKKLENKIKNYLD